ncbi:potassium transporter Kup [Paramagnetospirillum kuznetsovii]|uniref:Probable potassium transport system protein Kup n=1 Tax=Paramagnetospirillum kuznetsovii TaxID=2053833 RepID=A0A364P215_9PROT|nr:potassium transporter Kup [Paramagnetospirillum kuznetsovii]RAU23310.1 potassium transporter Kup [Paramagnetospirillum kuznetsovii]
MEPAATEKTDIKRLGALSLAAMGVVYGDIGTSPLYTLKECFDPDHGVPLTPENIYGIASLVFWAIIVVVTLKYVLFVMRADNRGEGGILALLALAMRATNADRARIGPLVVLGLIGAALFFGDGVITPAISVLSAVEGLEVGTPMFQPYVIPITLAVLIGLFAIQSHGTELVGKLFGPVMVVWFVTIAVLGFIEVAGHPGILTAINPAYGLTFLFTHGWIAFIVLGSVVLAVTGGEALYADMGHFGKLPIQISWFVMVLPALMLSYLGQAALLLDNPEAVKNPFYLLAPDWALYPLVALATLATVIASQAVISGVFSLSRQAVQLGYSPRLDIRHTSDEEEGQIYIARANWGLLIGIVALVVGFKSSTNLAAAYGIAVTGTMATTTVLALVVARHQWKWPAWLCIALGVVFLVVDLAFFGANLLKVANGGWFPLAVGAAMFLAMSTWRRGRVILAKRLAEGAMPLEMFLQQQKQSEHMLRVRGTAIFMTGDTDTVPIALLHNLKHNKALHQRVVFMTVITDDIPRVSARDRVVVEGLAEGFYRITVRYGFFQEPDIPKVLRLCKAFGLEFDMMDTSFFLGRETVIPSVHPEMAEWRERLYVIMGRNAVSATDFFRIPAGRVVELGIQVQM